MATDPAFAVTPRIGSVSTATADSSFTAPTNAVVVITGGAAGTRIAEVVVKVAVSGLSSAAVVRLWLVTGTSFFLFDEIALAAATSSASVVSTRGRATYDNLILPSASWSLQATISVAQTTTITALAADL